MLDIKKLQVLLKCLLSHFSCDDSQPQARQAKGHNLSQGANRVRTPVEPALGLSLGNLKLVKEDLARLQGAYYRGLRETLAG